MVSTGIFYNGVEWEVFIEGDKNCKHVPSYTTLTSDPPIEQIQCTTCARTLWHRMPKIAFTWPATDRPGYGEDNW